MYALYLGDGPHGVKEIEGRYRGDIGEIGEILGRYRGDIGEI